MLCHHAYLHGTGLTTIFSIAVLYMNLYYTSNNQKSH